MYKLGEGGAMVFLCDQTFFDFNVQFFQTISKAKSYFSVV